MTSAQIEEFVIDSLGRFLQSMEKEVPTMNGKTRPIGDLGLESDDEVDWLCDIEDDGFVLPKDVRAWASQDATRALTITEIAKVLQTHAK
jgi:hypothetical protein